MPVVKKAAPNDRAYSVPAIPVDLRFRSSESQKSVTAFFAVVPQVGEYVCVEQNSARADLGDNPELWWRVEFAHHDLNLKSGEHDEQLTTWVAYLRPAIATEIKTITFSVEGAAKKPRKKMTKKASS